MSFPSTGERAQTAPPAHFQTTHWSVVLAVGQSDSTRHAEALEYLCRAYWYSVYGYVRQRGHRPEDAQDLTQEFLARLIHRNWLAHLDPHNRRFRSFLLTVLGRFLINQFERGHAVRRGGGKTIISLDQDQAEGRFALEPHRSEEHTSELQ